MTDNEHKNQIGMGLGADAANDAAGEGSGVPMDYEEARDQLDCLYQDYHEQVWEEKVSNVQVHDDEVIAAMSKKDRLFWHKCQAIIRHWEENPNG
jgi:hypothetical protein